jgi:hypothetical protein
VLGASACLRVAVVWSQHVVDALYVDSTVWQVVTSHDLPASERLAACRLATGTPYCTVLLFDRFIRLPFWSDRDYGRSVGGEGTSAGATRRSRVANLQETPMIERITAFRARDRHVAYSERVPFREPRPFEATRDGVSLIPTRSHLVPVRLRRHSSRRVPPTGS